MAKVHSLMSTGLPELDNVLQGVRPGDNIVWQVDSIEDYIRFVHPFCKEAYRQGEKLIYFRFADHATILPKEVKAEIHKLHPEDGFESFIADIFKVIEKNGFGAFYIFDCLSELAVDWYSDRMLANFFMLTCPYLYDFDTATYFALLRNYHTTNTINAIHNTAQVVIDVYHNKKDIYIQPLKVYKRYTPTMYTLHMWQNKKFQPVTKSTVISEILKDVPHPWLDLSISRQDMWNRFFDKVKKINHDLPKDEKIRKEYDQYYQRLLRMIITRDEQVLELARKHLDLADLIDIGKHMIGTGLIGGKAVGMLLARSILEKKNNYWKERLEPHDSFFIGSDVFYTYLIRSGCWWVRWKLRNSEDFLDKAEEARKRLLIGTFPEDIQNQFLEILNYYGQSPLIVRSSSLLEDAYGNSFSGKYESVFLVNQGTPQERLEAFVDAVRTVYASTMNQEALLYRARRGLLNRDEQMALLVQRVSGDLYKNYFYPQIAGVGFSFNPYVWNKDINPESGMLRLVFGLGTRAVERHDDDYTRIVALNAPLKRPESDIDKARRYMQHQVDVLDLNSNQHAANDFETVVKDSENLKLDIFASRDLQLEQRARENNQPDFFSWMLTFENLFSRTDFIKDMQEILKTLQDAYKYPVDIEFTANFIDEKNYRINLVQCRPFQVKKDIQIVKDTGTIKKEKLLLRSTGPIIGNSIQTVIDKIIYVVPEYYSKMNMRDRYEVARLIGKIVHLNGTENKEVIMLLGPGRWATTSPSLGVPVQFAEINKVSIIGEIAEMHEGLVPDVSLGTHFFNDLVEMDMLYMAFYPKKKDVLINDSFLKKAANKLSSLLPEEKKFTDVLRVIDFTGNNNNQLLYLNVNAMEQMGICYFDKK